MAASTSSSVSVSKSAQVRARLKHPVIDSDGHTVEFQPALRDYIRQVAGPDLAGRYRSDGANWYRMSWDQRRAEGRCGRRGGHCPTKNTLDRATATFPKLLHERLDQTGIDFAVLYPTAGLARRISARTNCGGRPAAPSTPTTPISSASIPTA